MTTLFILGLMFFGALLALVAIPLVLLKVAFAAIVALVVIPFKIVGAIVSGLGRGLFKGMFLLALLMAFLALVALPFVVLAFGIWLLFRAFRPKRPPQAYVVS